MQDLDETALKQWIEDSLATNSNVLAAGYQGQILHYQDATQNLLIKVPHGHGLARKLHLHMLRHEYEVYEQLGEFEGAPTCYGLVDDQYLVLEYIAGRTIRKKRPLDEDEYHQRLFEYIRIMHSRGVAHMDLKRKDNLLVKTDESPCILDFGTAVIKEQGFHPVNEYHYRIAKQFDYNAWIKHKYHDRNVDEISMFDRKYYRVTWIEAVASAIKSVYTKLIGKSPN
jgi:predicted Ser/Thr protein kinase